jgi:hypothetical protein
MFGFRDQFSYHCLDDAYVAVEKASQGSPKQGEPNIRGKANHDHGEHCSSTSRKQDWFSTYPIRQTAPEHTGEGLSQREGGDEEAGIERGILIITNLELLDEWPGIGKD